MFSVNGFEIEKRQAKLARAAQSSGDYLFTSDYTYYSDLQNQWESSYSNTKLIQLLGTQSLSKYQTKTATEWLEKNTTDDANFIEAFQTTYDRVVRSITTCPVKSDLPIDVLETRVDRQLLGDVKPLRVLDIGGGAGRNMVQFMLSDQPPKQYVSVDSIALCYAMQNAVASELSNQLSDITFIDLLDYKLAHLATPDLKTLGQENESDQQIVMLPGWMTDSLPNQHFDLILCNHVLDDLPPEDFKMFMALIERTLAPEGQVYCRGSQHRSAIKDIYPLGGGTYHGLDITQAFAQIGLHAHYTQRVAGEFTRIFKAARPSQTTLESQPLCSVTSDHELVQALQAEFIQEQLSIIESKKLSIDVWGEAGFATFNSLIKPMASELHFGRFTHRFAFRDTLQYSDLILSDKEELFAQPASVILVAVNNTDSVIRELTEALGDEFELDVRSFSLPIAFIYLEKR